MTTRELVAYFNLLRYPVMGKCEKDARHLAIVTGILTDRGLGEQVQQATQQNRRLIPATEAK